MKYLELIEMDKVELQYEKRDSVEVTRNAKGEYGWKIKQYYNASDETIETIVADVVETDRQLRVEFLDA